MRRRTFRLGSKMPKWKRVMAKVMSRNMSMPERILWHRLKDKQLGVNFYKQKLAMGYILDFFCPRAALCVEVDGPQHLKQKSYDANRDVVLMKKGILTMRFTAQTVVNNPAVVAVLIADRVRKRMT
jgi:very-short-patch-repair endonuclease